MSKVLFLFERDTGTIHILKEMFVGDFKYVFDVTQDDINNNDVIFFIRPSDILSASIAKRVKQSGRFVISFYDDDLLNYMRVPTWGRYAARRILSYSDVMLSFNPHLCKKYLRYIKTKRAVKIDMLVKEKQICNHSHHNNDKIKIVYAASPDNLHVEYFDEIVRSALKEITAKYSQRISLNIVSVHPELSEFSSIVETNYFEGMQLSEYRKFMAEQNFDIGLAPLHGNEFTRCKYFNKYIEYSMSGIFGIYSNVEPYNSVIENGKNGILVNNTKDEWVNALENTIVNFVSSFEGGGVQIAQDDLRKNFNESKIMKDLAKSVPEFFEYEGKKQNCKSYCKSFGFTKFLYNHMNPLEVLYRVIYRVCYYLNQGGIKNLIIRSIEHFKRKKGK